MDLDWISGSLVDVISLGLAFALGMSARAVRLPPLVGFLAAGFVLNGLGIANRELIETLSDLGITLLLFTVGLKVNLRTLTRPQVWAVTTIHVAIVVALLGAALTALAMLGLPMLLDLSFGAAVLVAFALSFSSTVFVVKVLEQKGEMQSLHGRLAIGVLIVQDIAAVIFLAFSTNKLPSIWALALTSLFLVRPLLHQILSKAGHGELQILFGFLLALGGAEVFELVGVKGDLGALALGLMISSHAKSDELAKTMLGFKDLFLLGFFLSIGLSGQLSADLIIASIILLPFLAIKSLGFFALFSAFKLRARTSLLTTFNLSNYSEFGLIVMAVGVSNAWVSNDWLIVIALAMSWSFAISAVLNARAESLFVGYRSVLERWQRAERLPDDRPLDLGDATIAIIGMGGVGTSAYEEMRQRYGDKVVGVDIDPITVAAHCEYGRRVLAGDPTDADFWERIHQQHILQVVMLALPKLSTTLEVLSKLHDSEFDGDVAATTKFDDEAQRLKQAGVDTVFNTYEEAGSGFAVHVSNSLNTVEGKSV